MANIKISAADMLVIMPPGILEEVKDFFDSCHASATIDPKAAEKSHEFLDAMYDHDANQTRLYMGQRELRSIIAEAKSFDAEKVGMAAAITFMFDSRSKNLEELEFCLSVLDELLSDTDTIKSLLHTLQGFDNTPPTSTFDQYITRQRIVYTAFKKLYLMCKASLNSQQKRYIPGEQFGMIPFEDIMYSSDGQVLIWNDSLDDWDLPDDVHPCRNMPGSNWGKFFYEMTPGDFFTKEKRPTVEWAHASPLKKVLESLQTTHFLASSATPGPALDSSSERAKQYNIQLAAATGVPYPIYDTENSERTPYNSDVSALVSNSFQHPPEKVTRPYELSRKVEEVATGNMPEVTEVQEMEAFVYRLPQ
ncbi:uncharacterized protein SPSK_06310 [Sporothrix schenckii 1099-18]|uniref:Uncharacterized protein n=2 Tax=Sporothrix schenckii TaxID=29908 RepID=A0A0F2MN31_SPOSC|nr:uncharacterized protein SPSK_06310 [Sporothrix schenckii 1099-18]AGG09666.1 HPG domain containing protein [Sporothrix schenckii]KJR89586.1 hypothetical protein SPSK_06310 [Sporothrix schenckii 1099-18]